MPFASSEISHTTGPASSASHYPPYSSRPAAQSGAPRTLQASTARSAPSSRVGTKLSRARSSAGVGSAANFLSEARGIEITKADRQASPDLQLSVMVKGLTL